MSDFNREEWAVNAVQHGLREYDANAPTKFKGEELGLQFFWHPYITDPKLLEKPKMLERIYVLKELQDIIMRHQARIGNVSRIAEDENGVAIKLSPTSKFFERTNQGLIIICKSKEHRALFAKELRAVMDEQSQPIFEELFEEGVVFKGEDLLGLDTNWDHAYEGVKTNGRSGQPKPIDPTRILMLACPSVLEFPEEGIWRNRSKAEIEEEAGMVDSEVEEEPEVTTTKEGEAAPF